MVPTVPSFLACSICCSLPGPGAFVGLGATAATLRPASGAAAVSDDDSDIEERPLDLALVVVVLGILRVLLNIDLLPELPLPALSLNRV